MQFDNKIKNKNVVADNKNISALVTDNFFLKKCFAQEVVKDEDYFKRSILDNPANDKNYAELGWFYMNEKRNYLEAEKALKKALELNPGSDVSYSNLGQCLRMQGKWSQAEEMLRKAFLLNLRSDNIYSSLGWLYLSRPNRDLVKAEESFKKVLEINPRSFDGYSDLGLCYREEGKFSEAETIFKKSIELNLRNHWVYFQLGCLYAFSKGDYLSAEWAFKKSLELNPDNDVVNGALALVYWETERSDLAEKYYRKANEIRGEKLNNLTYRSYHKIKEMLDLRHIKLVCVQYPVRSLEPLKKIFTGDEKDIIFVDNEKIFKDVIKENGYKKYFIDMFGGDFGHCTSEGNKLLASNVASQILKYYFNKNINGYKQ